VTDQYIPAATERRRMSADADLSDRQRAGLELIRETGGIHQSEFWKELDVSSRTGSRIVDALAEKGLIERESVVYEGHNTYHLTPVRNARDRDFSLLLAGDQLSPFVGEDDADPLDDDFSQWIMNLAYQ
jgi:hypothetical protein